MLLEDAYGVGVGVGVGVVSVVEDVVRFVEDVVFAVVVDDVVLSVVLSEPSFSRAMLTSANLSDTRILVSTLLYPASSTCIL